MTYFSYLSFWGNTSPFLCALPTFRLKKSVYFLFWPALSWVSLRYPWQNCPAGTLPCCWWLSCWGNWGERSEKVGFRGLTHHCRLFLDDWGGQQWCVGWEGIEFREEDLYEGLEDPVETRPGCTFSMSWSLLHSGLSLWDGSCIALPSTVLDGARLGNRLCHLSSSQKQWGWKQWFQETSLWNLKPVVPGYRYYLLILQLLKALRWFPLENHNITVPQEPLVC